jgi:hypothetical protein
MVSAPLMPRHEQPDILLRLALFHPFDALTLKQARQLAGTWDLAWLTAQYTAWIEQQDITPRDRNAHFLAFIRAHRERNGETV